MFDPTDLSAPPAVAPAPAPVPPPPPPQSRAKSTGSVRASYQGDEMAGRRTANGEVFDPDALTAASKTFPIGSTRPRDQSQDGEIGEGANQRSGTARTRPEPGSVQARSRRTRYHRARALRASKSSASIPNRPRARPQMPLRNRCQPRRIDPSWLLEFTGGDDLAIHSIRNPPPDFCDLVSFCR